MAFAPVPVKTPPRTPLPRGRLLDILTEFEMAEDASGNSLRWLHGVTWAPEPCEPLLSTGVDVCSRKDFADTPRFCVPWVSQSAFSVYDALRYSLIEWEPGDIADALRSKVNLKSSAAFASELITGAASGGMALSKSAVATAAGAAAGPIYSAIASIEASLAVSLQGARGVIHLPPALLTEAVRMCGLRLNADGQWETPLGNLVISDAGYQGGRQPVGFGAAATSVQGWIYGSGPVQYRISEPALVDDDNLGSTMTTYTSSEHLNDPDYTGFRTRNQSTRILDRMGILIFDPCPVVAALSSYSENA